jgi:hypothetical protein
MFIVSRAHLSPRRITSATRTLGRFLASCALVLALSGCTHYDITLTNGDVVRARNKPTKDENGLYRFKDLTGTETTLNPMRIRQIEPVRRGSQPSRSFIK